MNISLSFVEQLDQPTREALERLAAEIVTGWSVGHTAQGGHKPEIFPPVPPPGGGGDVIGTAVTTVVNELVAYADTTGKRIGNTAIPYTAVARTDAANTFTQQQQISNAAPLLLFNETDQPANARLWRLVADGQLFVLQVLNDAASTVLATPLYATRTGAVVIGTTVSVGTNPAQTGDVRLTNVGGVWLRNGTNTADIRALTSWTNDALYVGGSGETQTVLASGYITTGGDFIITGAGTVQGTLAVTGAYLMLDRVNPRIYLRDAEQAANNRYFDICNVSQSLLFRAYDDALTTAVPVLWLTRPGDAKVYRDIYEKQRSVALGHWQAVPFSAGNFSALAPMTWTVASAVVNRYTLVGKTLTWNGQVSGTTGGAISTTLSMVIPGGYVAAATSTNLGWGLPDGATWQPYQINTGAGSGVVSVLKLNYSNFALGTVYVYFTITIEVQ